VPWSSDMACSYREATLVISRAGAITLAELGATARAAYLIPLADHAGGHQSLNAREIWKQGGKGVEEADWSDAEVAAEITTLLGSESARARVAAAMQSVHRDSAAQDLVAEALLLARAGS
jgi:UDP-N-acetylglucosamine--N-acetylmuramyl-(pentapeptide) pyrophosphoryl-undecaprenol N-acetylglucosamine transferase